MEITFRTLEGEQISWLSRKHYGKNWTS